MTRNIKGGFKHLNKKSFPILFKSKVRPLIEYGNVVWSPTEIGRIKQVEKVQRRATKLVGGIDTLPYEDRIKWLNLPSLEHRRRRGDMIEVWKRFHGGYDDDYKWLIRDPNTKNLKYHNFKLFKKRLAKGEKAGMFWYRVVDDWNRLPSEVVNAKTLNSFKNLLDRHWKRERFQFHD